MAQPPKFGSDEEEATFWEAHDSTQFLEDTEPVDVSFVDARPPKKMTGRQGDAVMG